MTQNPFATPLSDSLERPSDANSIGAREQYRLGKILIHGRSGEFADRCVKCNAPVSGPKMKRILYWHHPAVYVVLLLNVLFYAIVAMAVRKKAEVHIGLCEEHRAKRRLAIMIGWVGSLLSLGATIAGFAANVPVVGVIGMLAFLVALIWGIVGSRAVMPMKIDDYYVRVSGVCKAYLDALPEWSGAK